MARDRPSNPEPHTLDRTEVAISKCSVAKLKAEASHLGARLREQRDVHRARLEELERHYDAQVLQHAPRTLGLEVSTVEPCSMAELERH